MLSPIPTHRALGVFLTALLVLISVPVLAQRTAPAKDVTTLQLPGSRPMSPEGQRARALDSYLKTDPNAPETTGVPSQTIRAFLLSFPDEAAGRSDRTLTEGLAWLELKGVANLLRDAQRRELAENLRTVLTTLSIPQADALDRRAASSDLLEVTTTTAGAIKLRKMPDGLWKFTDETIEALPQIFVELDSSTATGLDALADPKALIQQSAREILPNWARKSWAGAAIWQWAVLTGGLFLGLPLLLRTVRRVLHLLVRVVLGRYGYKPADTSITPTIGATSLLITAYLGFHVLNAMSLPARLEGALTYLFLITVLYGALGTIWFGLEGLGRAILRRRHVGVGGQIDDILVAFVIRALKILLILIGLAFAGSALGFNITALLAGLGIGGVAIALAAKNTIENLLGTITIIVDRPFRIGDRIKINTVEGVVTKVGLRSTRITTLTESAITLPNHQFVASTIENLGPVPKRIWRTTISLDPSNPPDRLTKFTDEVRALLRNRTTVVQDSILVRISDFGPRSLSLLISVRIKALDESADLATREEMILGITHLMASHEIVIAPPGT